MKTLVLPFLVLLAVRPAAAETRELSLSDALSLAEHNSPHLRAASEREHAAEAGVGVAKSAYYPSIAADGVDSWGFPGSSGYLGLGGLVGSPYRSGAAAGLVARDTLFDFGRTYDAVEEAKLQQDLARVQSGVDKYAVDLDMLRTFYSCSRFRSEHEVWDSLHSEIEMVANEVVRYVNTGQRSVVDRYLSEAQVEEARTNRNYFRSRMDSTVQRLALLAGIPSQDLSCPALPPLGAGQAPAPASGANPYVLEAQARLEVAKSRLTGARADYLPKIVGVASVGAMERSRLVAEKDWSGGLGVVVPLFDGFGTVDRVARERAEVAARTQDLGAVKLDMDEANARLDEIIRASQARLEHLTREEKLAQDGFKVAKNRYFKYQGTLVDLRDALRNLGRIETDMSDTQATLLEAAGSKALLAGAAPIPSHPRGEQP